MTPDEFPLGDMLDELNDTPGDDLVGYSVGRLLDEYIPHRKVTFFKDLQEMQGMFDDDVTDLSSTIHETLKARYAANPTRSG